MLQLKLSNRFESLLDSLQDAMAAPPASPFVREEIIVPSVAVRRRIELAAADRFGICANVGFSFLAQWLWRQIGQAVAVGEVSPFTAPVLAWRVLAMFDRKEFVADHPPLARYLRDADDVMRYELAQRTARLLEEYLTYRPDWLAAWLAGKPAPIRNLDRARREDERWQGALWRLIARDLGTGSRHPSVAFFEAMRAMGPDAPALAGLPAAAHVFCLPTIPPLYLDILQRLSRWIDLTFYVINPCREYWFDIVAPRRLSYLTATGRAGHHEIGNRLLASWGRQTQAHIDLLLTDDSAAVVEDAAFAGNEDATLLAQLQNAVLDMTDLARGSVALAPGDRSVEVHVCHSLTRELEVLQDQLLALFAAANPPRPSDILVVTPDLKEAAPLIDAVFGNAPKARAIPYTITGRPASARNPCAQALLAVLAVATSRFAASAVFELLHLPIIARRFGIDDQERETIHAWLGDAGIRWGIDGEHRRELGLPPVDRHSFSDGLDRLFMGYALPADAATPQNGRLPAGNAEGSNAPTLGSFRDLIRALERVHDELRLPSTPAAWRQTLLDLTATFLQPIDDDIEDLRETLAGVHELHDRMTRGGMNRALGADVVRKALQEILDDPTRGGMPSGAVTFAAMSSLRHLPYRFVCVLGMNDGAFPSTPRADEFDLMAHDARRGDRQRRSDERNVFLDLLLAARERLHLSYTGRSVRDNSPLPPSVLVADLLDYAAAAIEKRPFSAQSLADARAQLVVEHPLQPFSIEYFEPEGDPRRRSFDDEYCEALRQRLVASAAPASAAAAIPPGVSSTAALLAVSDDADEEEELWEPQDRFFHQSLPAAGPEFRDVTLANLLRFFRNPCRYLLRERLGIDLPEGDEELQDDEPFTPDWRARSALAQRLLPRMLAGDDAASVRALAQAGTEYPAGRFGDMALGAELQQLAGFACELAPALAVPTLDPVTATFLFTIDDEPWRLTGGFGDLRPNGRTLDRYDDVRAGDYLEGWIEHLFLNAMAPSGVIARTAWHSRDGIYRLPPIAGAAERLAALLLLYRAGLHRPLRFFPKSAWAFLAEGENLTRAANTWLCTRFRRFGEERDPAYRLALRGIDNPLDDEFASNARTVYAPLLDCIDDDRLKP